MITTARLTNNGTASVTNLSFDIVQSSSGIPANVAVEPDLHDVYLGVGQSIDVQIIPLELVSHNQAMQPSTNGLSVSLVPSLDHPRNTMMSIPGPFDAKVCAGDTCQLKTNVADNTCPAGTSPYTIPVPGAVMVSGSAAGWYCTNQPNVDVQVKLPIPRGATIRMGTVSMNFSPSANTTYQHEMALRVNNMPVGNAIVPGPASTDKGIQWAIPLEAMLGFEERLSLNIRSFHPYANLAHYIIANTFKVDVVVENVSFNLCAPSQADAEAKANAKVQAKKTLYANTQGISVLTDINGGASETVPACTVFHTTGRFVTRNNVLYAEVTYATNVVQGITLVLSNAASQGTGWVSINDLDPTKNAVYERPASCNSAQTTPTPTTPASCPWGGTVVTPEPGTNDPVKCQYTFNADQRHKAAQYAISWAAGACPMFCAFQYHPYVTPSPLYPTPANGYACINDPTKTDCANFVSQAYLYAGWPMTTGWGISINDNIGLRQGSWGWATKTGLPNYFISLNGIDIENKVTRSKQTGIISDYTLQSKVPKEPWATVTPDPTIKASVNGIWRTLQTNGITIEAGDLMYTYNPQYADREHVLMVVGWGPYVSTWQELQRVQISNIVPSDPYPNLPDYVPYIVDHGANGIFANANPSSPYANQFAGFKPYYAVRWSTDIEKPEYEPVSGVWYFVALPDVFTLPTAYYTVITPANTAMFPNIGDFPALMPTICPINATAMALPTLTPMP